MLMTAVLMKVPRLLPNMHPAIKELPLSGSKMAVWVRQETQQSLSQQAITLLFLTRTIKYDCDIVYCQTAYLDDQTGNITEEDNQTALPLFKKFRGTHNSFSLEEIEPEKIFSYDSFVVAWNKITKRSLIEKINARFPERFIFEDMPFYFNTLLNAKTLSVVWERLIYYRINRKNSIMNASNRKGEIVEILQTIAHELQATKSRTGYDYKNALSPFAYQELCYKFKQIDRNKLGRQVLDQILTVDDRKRFEQEMLRKTSFVSKLISKLTKPKK